MHHGFVMPGYVEGNWRRKFGQSGIAARWPLVRSWIVERSLPFYAELRENRPILTTPEVTIAARFADCSAILRRNDIFSVALYEPKQGAYWMAQDDTAIHWREKSIMKAILDREDIPKIRKYIADKAAAPRRTIPPNATAMFMRRCALRRRFRISSGPANRLRCSPVGSSLPLR
jgi:hypothetical protein